VAQEAFDMRIRRFLSLTAGCLLAGCLAAGAQEKGKAGVAIGYPGGIGVLWHATDKIAIRPDFVFTRTSTDGSSGGDGWGINTGLSVLFYVKKYDNVRTYVSPRLTYTRSTTTIQASTNTQGTLADFKSTSTSTGGAGVFGAQYSPAARFSVFGELGIAFSRRRSESSLGIVSVIKGSSWGTTAGVGVVFYP
jgi:hypothetical protein